MTSNQCETLIECLDYWADSNPEGIAWWSESKSSQLVPVRWAEIRIGVQDKVKQFLQRELSPHAKVVTAERNSLEWVLVDLACQAGGWVHVPLDWRLSASTKKSICERIRPELVVVLERDDAFDFLVGSEASRCGPYAESISQSKSILKSPSLPYGSRHDAFKKNDIGLARIDPTRLATILFTSGSICDPKGVQLSHRNLIANGRAKLDAMPQEPNDVRMNLLPFSHAYARTCELSTWLLSGSSIMVAQNLNHVWQLAPILEPTLFNGVPYVFEKIRKTIECNLSQSFDGTARDALHRMLGTKIRILAAGGAGLDEATYDWFSDRGFPIYQGYGLTEAGPVVCSNRYPNPSSKHVGWPVAETSVRIDERQRLFVSGPGVMVGYEQNSLATQEKIRDGWLDTGDLAEWTSDGAIRILGRSDDRLVFTTGYKLDPEPIESKLSRSLGIRHVMLALIDGYHLKLIIAIPKATEHLAKSVKEQVRQLLATEPHYAYPSEIMIVEDDWSIDNGMLNAKGTKRRSTIANRYLAVQNCV